MFTQCSNCHTVFQLSAEVLRAAGGQVRCGRCGEIFSALARLAEDASSFDTGESAYEMEERADSILETAVADQAAQAAPDASDEEDFDGSEIARLQVLDFTEEDLIDESPDDVSEGESGGDDAAMEFTLPPDELDRIFVDSRFGMPFPLEYAAAPMSSAAEIRPPPSPSPPVALAPPGVDSPLVEFAAPGKVAAPGGLMPPGEVAPPAGLTPPSGLTAPALPTAPADVAPLSGLTPAAKRAPPLAEDLSPLPDIEVISDETGTYDLRPPPQRSTVAFALWGGAAILSALLLIGQVVHRNREALTAHGPWAPALRLLYARMGAPLNDASNLAVYQLRQWGVTGDPTASVPGASVPGAGLPGAGQLGTSGLAGTVQTPADAAAAATLRVRASILNTSAQPQPFPLLRLTLANRYGTTLGARDFEPSEYMGRLIARAMSPGESVDAVLNILDPGREAEGFEVDVCLRVADKKIICANDAATAQNKP